MLWTGVLKLLVLASLWATGQSRYDCKTYDKLPGRCTSVGHCRDLCPGIAGFLRNALAIPFDDPACALPGIFTNAKQVCCPKLKCPAKVPILDISNITDIDDAENMIRTRRGADTQENEDPIPSDTNDTNQMINNDLLLNYYMILLNNSDEDVRHHTMYITHTVYDETRLTVVQTNTQTHFHTYDIPSLTSIVSTVELFTTLPVTHVTRSTITALPNLPTLTTTMTNLIHAYTEFPATKTLTTTIFGHTINKTSTFTPLCDVDINLETSSLLFTNAHTVEETITSTRTNFRTHVTSHYLFLTSYRSTTYVSTVTQTRVVMPTQIIYTTITAEVSDLTKTAYIKTIDVDETLKMTSTLPIGTHTLTETVYSSLTAQYHTVTATDCIISDIADTEIVDITTQQPLESTTEYFEPTPVLEEEEEEEVTEELSTIETSETTTETPLEVVTDILMTTDRTDKNNTETSITITTESTTIRNEIEQGTRAKTIVFCAIPSKKEKHAKVKVITCGVNQKNVICRKKQRMKVPENSVVLVTCYGSFTQRAKCGHDSKWRPHQINFNNNFTESFSLCDIPNKQ